MKSIRRRVLLLGATILGIAQGVAQLPSEITAPPGSVAFGSEVTFLPHGNRVVTDPLFSIQVVTLASSMRTSFGKRLGFLESNRRICWLGSAAEFKLRVQPISLDTYRTEAEEDPSLSAQIC